MEYVDKIKKTIVGAIGDATVHILDPRNDGRHLEAIVISSRFSGLSLLQRHQLVMNALKEEFHTSLHALSLKTLTPQQWEECNE